ncbi:MAG: 1-deoxy-D-xylulose-5-phosphate reductoisomerase, partial [Eubacterium sp.]
FYPGRIENTKPTLDLAKIGTLTFEKPDPKTFRCLGLAFEALKIGGSMPAVLNAANEISVSHFLKEKITFLDIPKINEAVMLKHNAIKNPTLDDILSVDSWARSIAKEIC